MVKERKKAVELTVQPKLTSYPTYSGTGNARIKVNGGHELFYWLDAEGSSLRIIYSHKKGIPPQIILNTPDSEKLKGLPFTVNGQGTASLTTGLHSKLSNYLSRNAGYELNAELDPVQKRKRDIINKYLDRLSGLRQLELALAPGDVVAQERLRNKAIKLIEDAINENEIATSINPDSWLAGQGELHNILIKAKSYATKFQFNQAEKISPHDQKDFSQDKSVVEDKAPDFCWDSRNHITGASEEIEEVVLVLGNNFWLPFAAKTEETGSASHVKHKFTQGNRFKRLAAFFEAKVRGIHEFADYVAMQGDLASGHESTENPYGKKRNGVQDHITQQTAAPLFEFTGEQQNAECSKDNKLPSRDDLFIAASLHERHLYWYHRVAIRAQVLWDNKINLLAPLVIIGRWFKAIPDKFNRDIADGHIKDKTLREALRGINPKLSPSAANAVNNAIEQLDLSGLYQDYAENKWILQRQSEIVNEIKKTKSTHESLTKEINELKELKEQLEIKQQRKNTLENDSTYKSQVKHSHYVTLHQSFILDIKLLENKITAKEQQEAITAKVQEAEALQSKLKKLEVEAVAVEEKLQPIAFTKFAEAAEFKKQLRARIVTAIQSNKAIEESDLAVTDDNDPLAAIVEQTYQQFQEQTTFIDQWATKEAKIQQALTAQGRLANGQTLEQFLQAELNKNNVVLVMPDHQPDHFEWSNPAYSLLSVIRLFAGELHQLSEENPITGMAAMAAYSFGGAAVLKPALLISLLNKAHLSLLAKGIKPSQELGAILGKNLETQTVATGFTYWKMVFATGKMDEIVKYAIDIMAEQPLEAVLMLSVAYSLGRALCLGVPYFAKQLGTFPLYGQMVAGAKGGAAVADITKRPGKDIFSSSIKWVFNIPLKIGRFFIDPFVECYRYDRSLSGFGNAWAKSFKRLGKHGVKALAGLVATVFVLFRFLLNEVGGFAHVFYRGTLKLVTKTIATLGNLSTIADPLLAFVNRDMSFAVSNWQPNPNWTNWRLILKTGIIPPLLFLLVTEVASLVGRAVFDIVDMSSRVVVFTIAAPLKLIDKLIINPLWISKPLEWCGVPKETAQNIAPGFLIRQFAEGILRAGHLLDRGAGICKRGLLSGMNIVELKLRNTVYGKTAKPDSFAHDLVGMAQTISPDTYNAAMQMLQLKKVTAPTQPVSQLSQSDIHGPVISQPGQRRSSQTDKQEVGVEPPVPRAGNSPSSSLN